MSDTHDSSSQAGVKINGEEIRRIREQKRLTQFYVSKVVGVTTDTVSRWENNRYPTIRKDNALKLAEALEVEFESLLQQTGDAEQVIELTDEPISALRKYKCLLILVVSLLAMVAVGYLLYSNLWPSAQIRATRYLPVYAAPGSSILVRVQVESEEAMKIILKEEIPPGWHYVASFPDASRVDNEHGVVRWIFKHSPLQKNIYYRLSVATAEHNDATVTVEGGLVANANGHQSQVKYSAVIFRKRF